MSTDTEFILNESTMTISSEVTDKICMVGVDTIIKPQKTEKNVIYVETVHFLITNIYGMMHPYFSYQDYNRDISIEKFIQEFKENPRLKVGLAWCRIKSIFNKKLLVTLKLNDDYYEIICNAVYGHNLMFSWPILDHDFNERACNELHLSYEQIDDRNKSNNYTHYLKIKDPVDIFSIEVLGHSSYINPKQHKNKNNNWFPDGKDSHFCCIIDYCTKVISSHISRDEDTGRGHRTSNGWKETVIQYEATLFRNFSTRRDIEAYLNRLPVVLKDASIVTESDSLKGRINISFSKPIDEYDFISLMGFSVVGTSSYAE